MPAFRSIGTKRRLGSFHSSSGSILIFIATLVSCSGSDGSTLNLANQGLSSGSHTISAKAYDNATKDLVLQVPGTTWGRANWTRSVQTVTWTVTMP